MNGNGSRSPDGSWQHMQAVLQRGKSTGFSVDDAFTGLRLISVEAQ
jgi:hypothetical protein